MSRNTDTLARIGLFRSLAADRIRLLDSQCAWTKTKRSQWIINYQDSTTDVFFVISGAVRVKLSSVSGRDVLLREINAGEYFGELAAIDGQPRSSGIQAVTDVTVARMPASVFRHEVFNHPDACEQVLTVLAGQIRTLANRINEFTVLDGRHRLYSELLRLSRADGGEAGRSVISPPPSQAEIAARISLRRESVARELKALERAGLLARRRGALVLTDTTVLQRKIKEASETV